MKLFSLYKLELSRFMHSKSVWLISLLCLCSPLAGYFLYKPVLYDNHTLTQLYIGNPVLAAAGSVLLAFLSLYEAGRQQRNSTDKMIQSVLSPVILPVARMLILLTIAAALTLICMIIYLPYTALKSGNVFHPGFYCAHFFIFILPTWWISVLFASGFYNITQRTDLSVIMYSIVCFVSLSPSSKNDFFLRWLNPLVLSYSDCFQSTWILRIGFYTRLIWLCLALSFWLISILCIRKYQKNVFISFFIGLKKIYIPIIAAGLICSGTWLWINQPFFSNGPDTDFKGKELEYPSYILDSKYDIKTHPFLGTVSVRAEYEMAYPFRGESFLSLNPGFKITSMTYDGQKVDWHTEKECSGQERYTYFTLPHTPGNTFVIEYSGMPTNRNTNNMYDVSSCVDNNYISFGWLSVLPKLNVTNCLNGTVSFTIPDTLTPFLNYKQIKDYTDNGDGTKTWTAECKNRIEDLTAAEMITETINTSDTQIDLIYSRKLQQAFDQNDARQVICDTFDYCQEHIGPLEFIDNGHVTLMQKSNGVIYANTGWILLPDNALDPDLLKNAPEGMNPNDAYIDSIVRQWSGTFGMRFMQDDLWSPEGFAVYTDYRIAKEKYGELYAKKYYADKWQKCVDAQNRSFYNRHPEYLNLLPEKYKEELKYDNESANYSARMPLMILKAQELIGSEEKMDDVIRKMYTDCSSDYDKILTYQDFLDYCGISKEALSLD